MKITWLGHSCFMVEKDDYVIVLDPYSDGSVPGLAPVHLQANKVYCSHEHGDHNARGNVERVEKERRSPFHHTEISTYHDEVKGAKRGPNKIHVLESDGIRVVHLGDLGCDLTEMDRRLIGRPDVLMIPVGGYYTIDAAKARQIASTLNPKVILPMHYRSERFGFDVIGELSEFTDYYDNVVVTEGSSFAYPNDFLKEGTVLVLTPEMAE
ncbi:MAG: MBL fold metallo-hydrolase [Lachnospiraceae bacterium]|nr:MBL fold metallo-hydrolase [Lachnospiraceae bacterium]